MGFSLNLEPKSWEAFLESVKQPHTYEESCAWLFSSKPFCSDDVVHVFPVKNVGAKGTFHPDKKDLARVKRLARKQRLTNIGNVHTHVIEPSMSTVAEFIEPSEEDLKFAKRWNNVVRGIVTVVFDKDGYPGRIFAVVWHDQHGKILHAHLPIHNQPIQLRKQS